MFTLTVAAAAVELSGGCDPDVAKNAPRIYEELEREERRFRQTLAAGKKVLGEVLQVWLWDCLIALRLKGHTNIVTRHEPAWTAMTMCCRRPCRTAPGSNIQGRHLQT